ncbi:alpha/beta fold hydrolase [Jiangella alba]|uniref:Pimeloyl-ACP methyl ester carboxylesterase n=1 Tax=Jiangella alba TaxID=561176 RepID=A0A1H5KV88_9ACTN|nr:alpha/beta hydrolase [Jiangella alba]SEE68755.1 Pimeloyl-ACP methyl ester carboxylesterase [Jiangella alba]
MMRLSTVRTGRGNTLSVATVSPPGGVGAAPLLLLHPINMRKECWLGLLPALAAERACVLVDLAGHGESTDDDFSLSAWVDDCADVVRLLGLTGLHVAGGSLGGAIAVGVAAALPDRVRSVTGLGSSVASEPGDSPAPADAAAVDALFAGLAREAVAPGRPDDVVDTVRLLTNRHGPDVVTRVLRAAYDADASGWLGEVRCPALWATGEYDVTCSLTESERIAGLLAAGVHVPLPGVGHLPMIEDPALVLAHLVPHLRAADAV